MKNKTLIALAMVGASTFATQAMAHNHDFSKVQSDMLKGYDSVSLTYGTFDFDRLSSSEMALDGVELGFSKRLGDATFVQASYGRGEVTGESFDTIETTTLYAGVGAAFAMGKNSLVDITMGLQNERFKEKGSDAEMDETYFVLGAGAERQINDYFAVRGGIEHLNIDGSSETVYSLLGTLEASRELEFSVGVSSSSDYKSFEAGVTYLF